MNDLLTWITNTTSKSFKIVQAIHGVWLCLLELPWPCSAIERTSLLLLLCFLWQRPGSSSRVLTCFLLENQSTRVIRLCPPHYHKKQVGSVVTLQVEESVAGVHRAKVKLWQRSRHNFSRSSCLQLWTHIKNAGHSSKQAERQAERWSDDHLGPFHVFCNFSTSGCLKQLSESSSAFSGSFMKATAKLQKILETTVSIYGVQ